MVERAALVAEKLLDLIEPFATWTTVRHALRATHVAPAHQERLEALLGGL
jgi:hypothetical protein